VIIITCDVFEEQAVHRRGSSPLTQKELYNLTTNIKTYKRETETLRQAKEAFEKAFDAKNADIRRTLTTELDRIHEEL
jgi:predicted RNA-binding protein with PIN domain